MATCLVTTLKESVTDSSLLKIGELLIKKKTNTVTSINMQAVNGVTVTIRGNGYFTDSTGTSNLGKTASVTIDNTRMYLSPGEYELVVSNKYDLKRIETSDTKLSFDTEELLGCSNIFVLMLPACDITGDIEYTPQAIEYLSYNDTKVTGDISALSDKNPRNVNLGKTDIAGDISSLSGLGRLQSITVSETNIQGNINVFSDMATVKDISIGRSNVTGDVSSIENLSLTSFSAINNNITGNLSSFSGMSALVNLTVEGTSVTGNLSSIASLTSLRTLNVANTDISGDTSQLAGLTNLTAFYYSNSNVTGTWPLT
jgi:hypothetical protein